MLSALDHVQGSTSRKNPWGSWPLSFQIYIEFSDLHVVTSKSISIGEKHGKLVASEKNLAAVVTPAVTTLSSDGAVVQFSRYESNVQPSRD